MSDFEIVPYKTIHGIEILDSLPGGVKGFPDAGTWCKQAEQEELAFSVFYEGKLILCVGIIIQREGVGLGWALYPPNVGDYHIDPGIAKDRLKELMEKHNLWRVEATVRVDFPAGESYLRYLGFKWEGKMIKNEPDKTDSFLYAITR